MFESYTYESILADALSRVTSDVDKREGSVIFDAIAPCCYKLAEYYAQLDNFIDLVLPDTAVGEYLDRAVSTTSLSRKTATAAVRTVTTSAAVNIGSRWSLDLGSEITLPDGTQTSVLIYDITALLSENTYSATCETKGVVGNTYTGDLSNIDNTTTATATVGSIITAGTDEETDDALRARFYELVQSPLTSGNTADYKEWALSVAGCGGAKVFPLWNGNGTVKILVVDENMSIDAGLPTTVAAYIETVRPIGATVTVTSPTGLSISVTASVKLDGSQALASVQTAFSSALAAYLKSEVFSTYSVSYAKVGALLLATAGASDYSSLLVNGGAANITIPDADIPVAGTVTLTEGS